MLILALVAGAGAALFANKDKVAGALAGDPSPEPGANTTTTPDPVVAAAEQPPADAR